MVIRRIKPFHRRHASGEFERLIEPHLYHLYQLAYRFCNNRDDAEDLVQDVVIKLLPRAAEMAHIDKLRPWLSKILYRQFVDHHRHRQRSPIEPWVDGEEGHGTADLTASRAESPEGHTEAMLTQKRLLQALETLNEDQRAVVLLHDVEGYTLAELETILDCPLGTLKSRLTRARGQLREHLKNNKD